MWSSLGAWDFFRLNIALPRHPSTQAFTNFHRLSVNLPEASPVSDRPYVVILEVGKEV